MKKKCKNCGAVQDGTRNTCIDCGAILPPAMSRDEETVRLRSHIAHARQCLSEDGGIGRKLDFIAQEMNREANTTLSKANDIEISNAAIDLKTEIEKVREQIQNIE